MTPGLHHWTATARLCFTGRRSRTTSARVGGPFPPYEEGTCPHDTPAAMHKPHHTPGGAMLDGYHVFIAACCLGSFVLGLVVGLFI